MTDIFSIEETYTLISAVERIQEPVTFLADAFFPNKLTVGTDYVAVEYRKQERYLAPYITKGTRGVNINRGRSQIQYFTPPRFGPRRVIGPGDVALRQFGETPDIYSPVTAEERAARLQAQDLIELMRLHSNRRGVMASEILQTGKVEVKAYADDGQVAETDTIEFDWDGKLTAAVAWSDPNADIYGDLYTISERIQERCGLVPTLAICGKNVERKLLKNKEIREWLMIPNRENLTMANISPSWKSPQVRTIGTISSLNLDLVSYAQTYIADDGTTKPYVDPDAIIIGIPGRGKEIHAPVQIFQQGQWHTISAPFVPFYTYNDDAQTTALTIYSRYILVPDVIDDWVCLDTGE